MKNTLVKRILRFALLGAVLMGSLVVAGCGKKQKISDSKASEVMKEMLYEKYGEEFEVSESWRLTNTDMGMPGIGGEWSYCADVYTKDGQTFQVAIDNDGNNFEDDYCKIILEKPLQEYVYGLVEELDGVELVKYNPVFFRDSYHWRENDDVEEFLKQTRTYICLDVEIEAESVDETALKCYEVYKILYDYHAKPCVKFLYDNEHDIIVTTAHEGWSEEEIIKSIKEKIESENER